MLMTFLSLDSDLYKKFTVSSLFYTSQWNFIAKIYSLVSFYTYTMTFYNESIQFGNIFSLDDDNKYFQVFEFLSEFHKHLANF